MQNWTSLPPLPGGPGVLPEMTGRRLAHLSIRLRFEQRAGRLPHCSRDTLGSKHPCSLFILLQVRATVEEVPGVEGSLQLSFPDQLPPNELRLDDPEIPGSDPESEACEKDKLVTTCSSMSRHLSPLRRRTWPVPRGVGLLPACLGAGSALRMPALFGWLHCSWLC